MRAAALLVTIAVLLSACAPRGPGEVRIGLELPLAGDAGADGLLVRNAIEVYVRNHSVRFMRSLHAVTVARDSSHGGSANAHVDEGRDASGLPLQAAAVIRDLAGDPAVLIAIGGLRPEIAAADAMAAHSGNLPLIAVAPLPDGCRAAGVPSSAPVSDRAVSVRGGASLESLAVERLVLARGYGRLAIRSDGTPTRADPALCLLRLLHGRGASASTVAPKPNVAGAAALVYFAPASLGVFVCDAPGAAALKPSAFTNMQHRSYDSRQVPPGCDWLRQRMRSRSSNATFARQFHAEAFSMPNDEALAGAAAANVALTAVGTAGLAHQSDFSKVGRDDISVALMQPDVRSARGTSGYETEFGTMRTCSGGSADGAWFELQPRRPDWPAPIFIRDRRCLGGAAARASSTPPAPAALETSAADQNRLRF